MVKDIQDLIQIPEQLIKGYDCQYTVLILRLTLTLKEFNEVYFFQYIMLKYALTRTLTCNINVIILININICMLILTLIKH